MAIEGRSVLQAGLEYRVSHENPSESEWVILHCKRGKEQLVETQLRTQQIETFIPKSRLPNYLFVRLDTVGALMLWVKTRNGVKDLVSTPVQYTPGKWIS